MTHPTDRITEDTLRERGAVQLDSVARHWLIATDRRYFDVFYYPADDTLRLYTTHVAPDGSRSLGGCAPVKAAPTWGDADRLCAALGIFPPRECGGGREKRSNDVTNKLTKATAKLAELQDLAAREAEKVTA